MGLMPERAAATLRVALVALACLVVPVGDAPSAHSWSLTEVKARFDPAGRFEIDLTFDADALLAGVVPGHMEPQNYERLRSLPAAERAQMLNELRSYFADAVTLEFDRRVVRAQVGFPGMEDRSGPDALPGRTIRLTGGVPDGAGEFSMKAPESFGTLLVSLRTEGSPGLAKRLAKPGETTRAYTLGAPPSSSRARTAALYARLGFEHIVPKGLDHILFVLGLFLLSDRFGPLVKQVTAFTVAHSLSLALSMHGVVSLPASLVEPLIALSIAYVAIENIVTSELKPWRALVVFGFGLLHGLGFAGVLRELGLPRGEFATALLAFNAGVELGQLSVIAIALLAVGWIRGRKAYRGRVVVPASIVIAAVGLYWCVERAVG